MSDYRGFGGILNVDQQARDAAAAAQATANTALTSGGGGGFLIDALLQSGNASVASNLFVGNVLVTQNLTNPYVRLRTTTAPTGANLVVTLSRNGNNVATLTLPAGQKAVRLQPTVKFYAGDLLNVSVTQVGSTVTGANLGITISSFAIPYVIYNTPGLLSFYDMSLQGASNGAAISGITDNYGGVNMALVGSAPTFSADAFATGKPGLVAPGTSSAFTRASPFSGLSEFTYAHVIKPTSANGDNYILSAGQQFSLRTFGSTRITLRLSTNGTSATTQQDTDAVPTNQVTLIIVRVSAAANKAQVELNGVSKIDTGFTGSLAAGTVTLGYGGFTDGGLSFQGVNGAMAISNKYLTGDELTDFRTAMGATAGLTL